MDATTSLSKPSLRSHLRILWAIYRKDWRQYWRYPLNAISSVLQPLVWLTPAYFMALAFSVNGKAIGFAAYSGTTDYISFLVIGTVVTNFINAVFWGMGYSLKNDMDAGVLESNWLTPIPRPLLLIGRTLSDLTITGITSLFMVVLATLIFGFRVSGDLLAAFLTALPMLLGLYGFGFAFAALVLVLREANTMVDVSSFLVQIFSGSSFPVNSLPRWLLPVSLALPLTYGLDAVRARLLGTRPLLPVPVETVLLIVAMFVMIAFGLAAFRKLELYVRSKGTLGQH